MKEQLKEKCKAVSPQEPICEMKVNIANSLTAFAAVVVLIASAPAVALDADAAEAMARQESCLKCHGIDKRKSGPAYSQIAAKYKDDPDAEQKLMRHVKAGEMVKLANGEEERHRIIRSPDENGIRNLVRWILSLQAQER